MSAIEVRTIGSAEIGQFLPVLVDLHREMVHDQAAAGFALNLVPEGGRYWLGLGAALQAGSRIFLGAFAGKRLVGAALLDLPDRTNARHRGEIHQLMVLRKVREQGVGRALLTAVHDEALRHDRSLVVFHTRRGDPSTGIFHGAGYREAAGTVGLFGAGSEALTLYNDLVSLPGTLRPGPVAPPPG